MVSCYFQILLLFIYPPCLAICYDDTSMSEPDKYTDRKKLTIGMIALAVISLVVYMLTMCPTVYVGDSGELIAASWSMGIPHSPGYPLFTMLGYLFSHAPIGDNPALRMNFMSALFGVISIILLYRLIVLITNEYLLSFASCLIFAFGKINWSQAVTTEVYTLNNLVVCIAIIYIILASRSDRKNYLYSAAFFSGLAFTTHQTSLLILPAGLWLLISTEKLPFKNGQKTWLLTTLFYILGLSLYLYLPLAASNDPSVNWGDPSNLNNFIETVFAPAFTQVNKGYFIDHINYFANIFFRELTPIGALLSIVGFIIAISTKSSREMKALAMIAFTYVLFFLVTLRPAYLNLYKLDVYYLPVFLISAVFLSVGAKELLSNIAISNKIRISKPALIPILSAIAFVCVIWNLSGNWDSNDRSDNHLAEWYGRNLLESCDDDSILLCNFDDLFILFYMQKVLGIREDVTAVLANFPIANENSYWKNWIYEKAFEDESIDWTSSRGRFLKSFGVEEIIESFIDDNISKRPIFVSFYNTPPLELLEIDYRFEPNTFGYKIHKSGQMLETIQRNYSHFKENYSDEYFANIFEKHHNVEEDFILVRCDQIFRFNASINMQVGNIEEALYFMTLSTAVNPLSWMNWATRANLEEESGDIDAAFASIDKIIEHEFLIVPEITPTILDWRYEQAKIFHRAGRNIEAAEILNQFYPMDARKPKEIQALGMEIENELKQN